MQLRGFRIVIAARRPVVIIMSTQRSVNKEGKVHLHDFPERALHTLILIQSTFFGGVHDFHTDGGWGRDGWGGDGWGGDG